MNNKYQYNKAVIRNFAINWQFLFSDKDIIYEESAFFSDLFEFLGNRYGLTREFKENGII